MFNRTFFDKALPTSSVVDRFVKHAVFDFGPRMDPVTSCLCNQMYERISTAMMNALFRIVVVLLAIGGLIAMSPDFTLAYGGPGSVISGIGTLLAAIAAVLAALFGFIWFPLKRLYTKLTENSTEEEEIA